MDAQNIDATTLFLRADLAIRHADRLRIELHWQSATFEQLVWEREVGRKAAVTAAGLGGTGPRLDRSCR